MRATLGLAPTFKRSLSFLFEFVILNFGAEQGGGRAATAGGCKIKDACPIINDTRTIGGGLYSREGCTTLQLLKV